jgi:chemotaxis protein MotB
MSPAFPPVIIKKKKARHGGHHGGAWKVAYADFVTALMAFFLVMWLVGQSRTVRAAVAGYFRDPGIFEQERSNGPIPGGELRVDPEPMTKPEKPDDSAMIAEERAALEGTAQRIRELLAQQPDLKNLEKQIEITFTRDGLRIELLDGDQANFFATGSSALAPGTERALSLIGRELGKLKNSIVIEGHTDSRPYSAVDLYSNWELSADRANAARRVMERNGMPRAQVRGVRGYADRQLRIADKPLDPRNRRVSVIVEHLFRREGLPDALESVAALPDEAARGRGVAPVPPPASGPPPSKGIDRAAAAGHDE